MQILAVIEAALALLFFMHLADNRGLMWFVIIFTVFVLLAKQYGWTDSFRLTRGSIGMLFVAHLKSKQVQRTGDDPESGQDW